MNSVFICQNKVLFIREIEVNVCYLKNLYKIANTHIEEMIGKCCDFYFLVLEK